MTVDRYFEGTLQLRNPSKELIKFVRSEVAKRPDVWIAKEVKVKDGLDMYISSWRFLLTLGQKLKAKYRGDLKESRRLFGTNRLTSKILYRVTVMFKLHSVKVGDVVKWRGRSVKVKQLGHKVSGIDAENGKRLSFSYEEIC